MTDSSKTEYYEDEINIVDIIKVLIKRKKLIIFGTIIPTILTILIGLAVMRKTYTSEYTYSLPEWGLTDYKLFQEIIFKDERIKKIADVFSGILNVKKETIIRSLSGSMEERNNFLKIETVPVLPDIPQKEEQKANILKVLIKTNKLNNFSELKTAFENNILYNALEEYHFTKIINKQIRVLNKLDNKNTEQMRENEIKLETYKQQISEYKKIRAKYGDLKNVQVSLSTLTVPAEKKKEEAYNYLPGREQMPILQQITTIEVLASDLHIKSVIEKNEHLYRKYMINQFNLILKKELLSNEKFQTYFNSLTKPKEKNKIKGNEFLHYLLNNTLKNWRMNYNLLRNSPKVAPESRGLVVKIIIVFFMAAFLMVVLAFVLEFYFQHMDEFKE